MSRSQDVFDLSASGGAFQGLHTRRSFLRRAVTVGVASPAVLALLAACGSSGDETPSAAATGGGSSSSGTAASPSTSASVASQPSTSQANAAATPKAGGTVNIPIASSPTSWDLLTSDWPTWTVLHSIYDRLLNSDENEKILPMLATSWETSPDGLTYTLKLRNDVKFHSGAPFNADAVKFNINRFLAKTDSAFYTAFQPIKTIDVVDDYTVKFTLSSVQFPFLFTLAGWGTIQIDPAVYQQLGNNYPSNPTGTGPFKFKSYVPDSYVDFVRNDNYWGGPPSIDGVHIKVIPQPNVEVDSLEAKSIDWMGVQPQDVDSVKKIGVTVKTSNEPGVTFLSLNVTQPPTDELAVRQAIAHAIDRKQIIDKVLYGYAVLARAGASPGSPYYFDDVPMIDFDKDAAGKILDDAGWKMGSGDIRERGGTKLSVSILSTSLGNFQLLNQIVQQQLKAIGIDSTITSLEWGTYLSTWRENKGGWNATVGSQGSLFRSTSVIEASWAPDSFWNICQIAKSTDPQIKQISQQLLDLETKINQEVDLTKRQALAKQAQTLYQNNQLTVWLWHGQGINAIQPYLEGYALTWHGRIINLTKAWLNK